MKKLIFSSLFIFCCQGVYSLPIGNPSEASLFTNSTFWRTGCCDPCDPCFYWFDAWSIRVGYYGDFVFNRNLRVHGEGHNQCEAIQDTELFTNAGYLVLNLCNMVDIFGTLGASTIRITTNDCTWDPTGVSEGQLRWETYFSWSAGARATLFERRCLSLGVEGQYFETKPHLTTYVSGEDGQYNYFNEDNRSVYREWQVGTGISYKYSTRCPNLSLVPYAGVKWSWICFENDNFQFTRTGDSNALFTIFNLKGNKLWGYAVGATFTICDVAGITVEGRWADEKALYVNGELRF